MILGERLRIFRTAKRLTTADNGVRTGVLRFAVSRVGPSSMAPTGKTIKKWARALGFPTTQPLFDAEAPPKFPNLPGRLSAEEIACNRSRNLSLAPEVEWMLRRLNDFQQKFPFPFTIRFASLHRGPPQPRGSSLDSADKPDAVPLLPHHLPFLSRQTSFQCVVPTIFVRIRWTGEK